MAFSFFKEQVPTCITKVVSPLGRYFYLGLPGLMTDFLYSKLTSDAIWFVEPVSIIHSCSLEDTNKALISIVLADSKSVATSLFLFINCFCNTLHILS